MPLTSLLKALAVSLAVTNALATPMRDLPDGRARPFEQTLCLNVKFEQGQPMEQLPDLAVLGVRWVRDGVFWPRTEPAVGDYRDFPPAFRQRLKFYRQQGIGVVYPLMYANSKAYPPTDTDRTRPADPEAFGRYAAQIARMLRREGVDFVLQIWNEPHNYALGKMFGGNLKGESPSPWLDHYLKLTAEAVAQVKAVDPAIRLIAGDDQWVIVHNMLAGGLPHALDGVSVHPYVNAHSIGPEQTSLGVPERWRIGADALADKRQSFRSAVQKLRGAATRRQGRELEIWVTEWGWSVGKATPFGPATEDFVAAMLTRAYIVSAHAGVEALCWFSAHDAVDGKWGLSDLAGRPRKARKAFATMSAQLGKTVLTQHLIGAEYPTSDLQAFRFSGTEDDRIVLWSTAPKPVRISIGIAQRDVRIVDVYGQPLPVGNENSADVRVDLGMSPIYLSVDKSVAAPVIVLAPN